MRGGDRGKPAEEALNTIRRCLQIRGALLWDRKKDYNVALTPRTKLRKAELCFKHEPTLFRRRKKVQYSTYDSSDLGPRPRRIGSIVVQLFAASVGFRAERFRHGRS